MSERENKAGDLRVLRPVSASHQSSSTSIRFAPPTRTGQAHGLVPVPSIACPNALFWNPNGFGFGTPSPVNGGGPTFLARQHANAKAIVKSSCFPEPSDFNDRISSNSSCNACECFKSGPSPDAPSPTSSAVPSTNPAAEPSTHSARPWTSPHPAHHRPTTPP
jgi:hypothetical protein